MTKEEIIREEIHDKVWALYSKNPNPRIEVIESLIVSLITEAEDKALEVLKNENDLANDIINVFPKFFITYEDWQYGNGTDAGRDFKRIYEKALRLSRRNIEDWRKETRPL